MSSTLRIRKYQSRLQAAATSEDSAALTVANLIDAELKGWEINHLQEIEEAATLLPEAHQRERYGPLLRRYFDLVRAYSKAEPPPAGKRQWLATVPFVFDGIAPDWLKTNPLAVLTGPLDPVFSGLRDAAHPTQPSLVLAVPIHNLTINDLFMLGFLLGQPTYSSPVDDAYAEMWRRFRGYRMSSQAQVFAFVFSITAPADRIMTGSPPPSLPMTAHLDACLDVLLAHTARINAAHPEVRMRLLNPGRLSEAVEYGFKTRLAGSVRAGLLQQSGEVRTAGREEYFDGAKVVLGLQAFRRPSPRQSAQVGVFSPDGRLMTHSYVLCPLGTTPATLKAGWDDAAKDTLHAALPVVMLPSTVIDSTHSEDSEDTVIRDPEGRWTTRKLAALAPYSRVLKTANWNVGIDPTYQTGDIDDAERQRRLVLQSRPVPAIWETMRPAGIVRAHYRDDVARDFLQLVALPGASRRRAVQMLAGKHPEFVQLGLLDEWNTLPPAGIYQSVHFPAASGKIFSVRPTLSTRLAESDLESGLPLMWLHGPFPDTYLHLQAPIDTVLDDGMPAEQVVGFYVNDLQVPDAECDERGVARGSRELVIELAMRSRGELLPISHPAVEYLIAPEDERDMVQQVNDVLIEKLADPEITAVQRAGVEHLRSTILLAAKLLLYCAMPSARKVEHMDRSTLLAQAKTAGGKQRDALYTRAAASLDYVEIGPEEDPAEPEAGASTGRHMRPHPRRGYIRAQAYGPKHSLRRPQWIPPTFVNINRANPDDPVKPYTIG